MVGTCRFGAFPKLQKCQFSDRYLHFSADSGFLEKRREKKLVQRRAGMAGVGRVASPVSGVTWYFGSIIWSLGSLWLKLTV